MPVAGGWGLGADSPVPTGEAAGDAPMLAHTLSFALATAILNPTYSKKKTNNREPDIEAYEIETQLGNKLTTLEAWPDFCVAEVFIPLALLLS
jgi:hypothetical protein